MVNPILKGLRNSDKNETAKLLRKHIGNSSSQLACKEAYEHFLARVKDDDSKSFGRNYSDVMIKFSPTDKVDWCQIVNVIASKLENDI